MKGRLNGRRPQWKTKYKMEDNLNGKLNLWKMISIEDDLNGGRHEWKTNSMDKDIMEEGLQ